MERILELAKKSAEAAEVFQVSSEQTQLRFESNRLKQLQTKQQTSVALRITKDGKTGYATATEIGDGKQLVGNAVETAEFGTKAGFEFPASTDYPSIDIYDDAVNSLSVKEMIGLGEEIIAAVTAHTPDIVCEGSVGRGVATVKIINSSGGQAEYRKSFSNLSIEGSLIEGTDMLFVGDGDSSCHPLKGTGNIIDTVLKQLDRAKNRAVAPTRNLPVVFTPNGVESAFSMPLIAAFNGKTVLQGASPVGEKLGQLVLDKKLSLYDDPTIPYRTGSRPCDDEGVASQRTPLIENGKVSAFLYDLQTAALAGKKSTGNGSRGRDGLPSPAPSALTIIPGDTTFDEMITDIKEGLVIEFLIGASQGNVLGGEFSGNVLLGYKIENGEITGRVKDTMVSGNIYKVLKDVVAVGSEAKWLHGALSTPPIYCPSVPVASKG